MSKKKYTITKRFKKCHNPTEIYPNFWICGKTDFLTLTEKGVKFDIIYPLDSLSGYVWNYIKPTETKIEYVPIVDYGILPSEVLKYLVENIVSNIKNDKKVCLFCYGGHGRTGYIAACVLGMLGIEDPVNLLWKKYCYFAIENSTQMANIIEFLYENGYNLIHILYPYFEKMSNSELHINQEPFDLNTQFYK